MTVPLTEPGRPGGDAPSGRRSRAVKLVLPWLLTVAIFAFLLARIPVGKILASLAGASWGRYLALMVPYSIAYFMIDSFAVTTAVRRFHIPVRYRDVLPVRAVTYVLALINSNVGHGGLAVWLHRREGVPLLAIGGTFLFLALIEIYQLVLYSSLGVAIAGTDVPGLHGVYLMLYAVLGLLLLYFNGLRALGWQRPAPGLLATLGRATLLDHVTILMIKSSSLLLAIAVHGVALRLFGMSIPFWVLLANLPLVFLASALPLTVAKLGTSQLAWIYLLGRHAPEAGLVAYSLTAHVTFLVMNALIGVAFLPRVGREVWQLAEPSVGKIGSAESGKTP